MTEAEVWLLSLTLSAIGVCQACSHSLAPPCDPATAAALAAQNVAAREQCDARGDDACPEVDAINARADARADHCRSVIEAE